MPGAVELRSGAAAEVVWRAHGLSVALVVAGVMAAFSLQPVSAQTCNYLSSQTSAGVAPAIAFPPGAALRSSPGCGGAIAQEAVNQTVQNVILDIRQNVMQRIQRPATPFDIDPAQGDAISLRRGPAPPPPSADSSSSPEWSPSSGSSGGPTLRQAVAPDWLYGVNLIGSGDKGIAMNTDVTVASVVGAVDVTKIGIFSSTDALTFIGTGIHSWATTRSDALPDASSTIPSTSATLVYLNGGFSTDLSVLASWTSSNTPWMANTSAIGYTANVQYRYDGPHSVWFEPTVGVTYGELFNGDFDQKTSDSTEIHGGLRFGGETKWMGYSVQPTLSGTAFKVVDQSGLAPVWNPTMAAMVNPSGAVGFRGSAKMTVLWQKNFSSYIDFHATTMSSPEMPNIQVLGVQGGLRYTF